MGQYVSRADAYPLEDQLKSLGDDELLDFWEESQLLDPFLLEDDSSGDLSDPQYERLILRELLVRSCRKRFARP